MREPGSCTLPVHEADRVLDRLAGLEKVISSEAVRQALGYATDRQAIVTQLFGPLKSDIKPIQSFTTTANEAGSVTLHWDISGPLLPGKSGVISFRVRVR